MRYEVEQKHAVADLAVVVARLEALGAVWTGTDEQVDRYYRHPARDFAQTDEALRIRRIGGENFLTYKGPKLDRQTKTRRELELPLAPGDAGDRDWSQMLEALGFSPVAEVRKQRRSGQLAWQGQSVELALDQLPELGSFLELELVTDAEGLEQARSLVGSLANHLGLGAGERRSYLELVLAARGG